MAAADAHGPVELLEPFDVEVLLGPLLAEGAEQRLLIDVVSREGRGAGQDVRLTHLASPVWRSPAEA